MVHVVNKRVNDSFGNKYWISRIKDPITKIINIFFANLFKIFFLESSGKYLVAILYITIKPTIIVIKLYKYGNQTTS